MQRRADKKSGLWEQRCAQYKKSGLSRKGFCKKHRLKLSTLAYWLSRLGKQEKERGLVELDRTSIAPLVLVPELVVSVGQDYRIEIRRGFDAQLLSEVIQALGGLR
jgi:hypothetical protein